MKNICYFDNAATTYPKPPQVVREVENCILDYCGNPGRGSHSMALAAAEKLYETRELSAQFFSCPQPDGVVFTLNATYALNLAIFGLVKPGSHVLISDLEHNSVLRPVELLKKTRGVTYSVFSTEGNVTDNIREKLRSNTSAVICTHASNITNRVLPIEKIGRLARMRGLTFIVDASQSAGVYRIDMERSSISALCMPGHKGLLGPQGIGMAIFSPGYLPEPLIAGGSGSLSRELYMPGSLPERLEAGTMPTPAIAGLCEGIRYVSQRGLWDIRSSETEIMERIRQHFIRDRRIVTYSSGKGPIWLFNVRGMSAQKTAQLLDRESVCVRSGLHCAPLAHNTLRTPEDGAVRASAGPMNTEKDADVFVRALEKVLSEN